MKRTRKWMFVAQEATRLAGLGLSPKVIAARLGIDRSTVTRWIASGKLKGKCRARRRPAGSAAAPIERPTVSGCPKSPTDWAKDIRDSYDLDATDDQLVTVAAQALAVAIDLKAAPPLRLQAAGRFQSIVKQLALVARHADKAAVPEQPKRQTFELPKRSSGDPRALLTAVK